MKSDDMYFYALFPSLDHFLFVLKTLNTVVYLDEHWWSHVLNAAPDMKWSKQLLIGNDLMLSEKNQVSASYDMSSF